MSSFPVQQAPAMLPVLRGACNRCLLCCTTTRDGKAYICVNARKYGWTKVGDPEAGFCAVYDRRTHLMPIVMRHRPGDEIEAVCAADGTPEETAAIVARGIGQGCSLVVG